MYLIFLKYVYVQSYKGVSLSGGVSLAGGWLYVKTSDSDAHIMAMHMFFLILHCNNNLQ